MFYYVSGCSHCEGQQSNAGASGTAADISPMCTFVGAKIWDDSDDSDDDDDNDNDDHCDDDDNDGDEHEHL